jgi:hypothetical protein
MAEAIQFPQSNQAQGAVLTPSTLVSPDLPAEFGGRPSGTSRRAIRMQEEWDKRREQQLQEVQMAQQMSMQQRQIALQERDQFIQDSEFNRKLKEYEAEQDIRGQAEMESNNILDWLGGRAVDNQGNPIAKPDPKTPEFQTEFLRRLSENPLGAELNKGIVDQYMGANKTYLDAQQTKQREEAALLREERMLGRQLAAEERAKGRQIESEERALTKAEEKEFRTQINKFDSDIREEELKLVEQASALGVQINPDGTFDSASISEKNRNALKGAQNRIKLIEMDKAQVQGFSFKTIEEAQKAESEGKIPSGTIIFVNGKRAIIE